MIDVVMCIRRNPDIDRDEFHRYWIEDHAARVNAAADKIGAVRYTQLHTIDTGLEQILQESRGTSADRYDGIAIIGFDSLDDMAAKGAEPDALAAADELLADEAHFIDHANSLIWFTEHHDFR